MKKAKVNYTYAIGRRRESSARVRLYTGKGESTVNGKMIDDYFPGRIMEEKYLMPFRVCEVSGKYYITVKVIGGGKVGQLDSMVLGTARALSRIKADYRALLKKAGLLTRDPRIRERRMVGTGGKSRRQKQSPKR